MIYKILTGLAIVGAIIIRGAGIGGGLPSSSEIDLQVQCTSTSGRAPLPVLCWAGTAAGTTATGLARIVDTELEFRWEVTDNTGAYAYPTAYRTGKLAARGYMPVFSYLFTEPDANAKITVYAEKGNGEIEGVEVPITVSSWSNASTYCFANSDLGDDAAWAAAGCPSADAETGGRTAVGSSINTLLGGITISDGTLVAVLGGSWSDQAIANPDGIDWLLRGDLGASRAQIAHTGCTSTLFSQRNGAGYSRLVGFDVDGLGGAAEGCSPFDQSLMSPTVSVPLQGVLLHDIDVVDNGIVMSAPFQNASATSYPDNFNQRLFIVDVVTEDLESPMAGVSNLRRIDAYAWALLDNESTLTNNNGEFHIRSQHQDKIYIVGNKFNGAASGKSQVTLRACNVDLQCGGNGNGNDSTNIGIGLWSQDGYSEGNIYDAGGDAAVLLGLSDQTNTSNGCQAHRRMGSRDDHFLNTSGTLYSPGKGTLTVHGRADDIKIVNPTFDARNIDWGTGNAPIRLARDNGGSCDVQQVPDQVDVFGVAIYAGTAPSTQQADAGIVNVLNGVPVRLANFLVYAPNWSGWNFCEGPVGNSCATEDEWSGISQGHVDAASNPFEGTGGGTIPSSSLHGHFKLSATRADGITMPPAGHTEWRKYDAEGNTFSAQPGAWANQ